jgi:phosphopantetheinyl transferase (holo-ACP synthase)
MPARNAAEMLGVELVHLSLSHVGGIAAAYVELKG